MTYNYDKLYATTPDALGPPTQDFVDFFAKLPANGLRVLDVGCGQGRDALFIARLGHSVVGVDYAPSGIRDLESATKKESLAIKGVVADITDYKPDGMFDVILIDRTLHMLPSAARLKALEGLALHVEQNGYLLIADEAKNIPQFVQILDRSDVKWETINTKRGYLFVRRL